MTPRPRLTLVALAMCRCDATPDPVDAPAPFACARPDEAPLPDGAGGHACVRVGAREGRRADLWPPTDGLPTPVVYVRPDAPAGGDGSVERPFAALSAALAGDAATVVLSRGAHRLDVPVTVSTRALVGADPATTIVSLPAGEALSVTGALTLRDLALRGALVGADGDVAVRARPGSTLTLDDVAFDGEARALAAEDATVVARHVTVRHTRRIDVELSGATRAVFRSLLLRDGGGSGLALDRARVFVDEALVAAHARKGVVIQGDGDPARGFADCRSADAVPAVGALDCFTDVASIAGRISAMQVAGARAVQCRTLALADTAAGDATGAADGLFVSGGADVTLDPEVSTDAAQGFGSDVVRNARFGVLVDGGASSSAHARVSVRGASVRGNARGGMFLQSNAVATRVEYSRFERNGGFGLAAVPSVTIASIGCNGFLFTQPAAIPTRTADGRTVMLELADGLSVSGAPTLDVTRNRFDGNARFAALFASAGGRVDGNTGDGNRFGLGVYASPALTVTATNRVAAREASPAAQPGVATDAP